MHLNFAHIVETFIGCGTALVVVVGIRRLASRAALRALRASLQLKGRLK